MSMRAELEVIEVFKIIFIYIIFINKKIEEDDG
jgi:hypothetical protein